MASTLDTLSVRDMLEALIAGQHNPRVLAELARGRMKVKHDALVEALTGQFDAHHGELARMLLDNIDRLTSQIETITARVETLMAAIPDVQGVNADGTTGPDAGTDADALMLPATARLSEITGIGLAAAQGIIAEIGLDMTRFPSSGHLVSWAKLCPRTIQSGSVSRTAKAGKGNPYLKGLLGDAAATSARTNTFLGDRYRRVVKRSARRKPSSPSPAPSWLSSGTYSPTPRPVTATSAPTTTPLASTTPRKPEATFDNCRRSATP